MFRCAVCGVNASSERNLQEHIRGRGHLRALDRQRQAERSIFVRGFGSETNSDSLQSLLEKHVGTGTVDNVWVSDNATYAMVEFKEPSDALKALKLTGMQLEGKKLVIKPRKFEVRQEEKKTRPQHAPTMPAEPGMMSELEKKLSRFDVFISEDKMKEIPEIEDQLQCLKECNKMTDQNIENQLQIAFQLLSIFRPFYPHCLVVPFGSIISGPGTRASDCDFCLVREPTPHLAHVLTGSRYFPAQLMPIVARLEGETGLSMSPGTSAPSSPGKRGATPPKKKATPLSRAERVMKNKELLSMISTVIKGIDATHVQSIPHARCPIVKFHHNPTGLHCDLSVDQCLGPLNSRLLKSYCEFDSRVATIVSCVKLWRSMMGVAKVKLNSYALSLMVIHCLQGCSPPVLPCLQDPGDWPRNMDHFKTVCQKKFDDRDNPWEDTPWHCGFTSPQTLLPSSNKESTVSLLLQFFKFYSQQFNFAEHVVSIRSRRGTNVTRRQAVEDSVTAGVTPRAMEDFLLPELVVQDPFDLAHNVTRALHPKDFKSFLTGLHRSYHLLRDLLTNQGSKSTSLLSIFDDRFEVPVAQPKGAILFTYQRVASLLCQEGELSGKGPALAQELEESLLGLEEKERLGEAVFGQLIHILTTKYSFICQESAELAESEETGCAPIGVGVEEEMEGASVRGEAGVSGEGGETGVRSEGGDLEASAGSSRKRKRALEEVEEAIPEELTLSKREKGEEDSSSSSLLQSLLASLPQATGRHHCYICTVWEKTWASARRRRREALKKTTSMEHMDTEPSVTMATTSESTSTAISSPSNNSSLHVQGMADTLPSPGADESMEGGSPSSPILRIRVTRGPAASWVADKVCAVQVECEVGERLEFLNFLALLRKELYSLNIPSQTPQQPPSQGSNPST